MRPVLLFDGDCHFCRRWISRWRAWTGDRVDYATSQAARDQYPDIPPEAFQQSVQLVETDGKIYQGAEAVFRSLSYAPGKGWMLWLYRHCPGFAPVSEWAYRQVSAHRPFFSFWTHCLWGSHLEPPTYFISTELFLRALALIYAVAFASLGVQILGLVGSQGILPVQELLESVKNQMGSERFWTFPTLFWLNGGDAWLKGVCVSGAILSLVAALGVSTWPLYAALWVLYLSLTTVCRDFLGFQWDNLLLETGLLAIFLAPLRFKPALHRPEHPSRLVLWLLAWLLFRLVFSSGMVKLASGDETWRTLTALIYHYQTQPLPLVTAWWMHALPAWAHRLSALVMFAIEIAVPFLIFLPRNPKMVCAASLVFLQVLIAATGNYCFFNLLSMILCLLLVDDRWYPDRLRKQFSLADQVLDVQPSSRLRWIAALPLTLVILTVTLPQVMGLLCLRPIAFRASSIVAGWIEPLRSVNSYGLFAVMTTSRPEIVLEGSSDGVHWVEYAFKYKPGDPEERPRLAAPHQPRLDWQMWFAALGSYRQNPWFIHFCARLLQRSTAVENLLDGNPFPDAPPRYIRAILYEYRFTTPQEKRLTGQWWQRTAKGLYCPVLSLRER